VEDRGPVERLAETLSLFQLYRDEAWKCGNAGAHLAGCVLLASALEAALLAMAQCFPAEVRRFAARSKAREMARPQSEWGLSQLLLIARSLLWLPSARKADDRQSPGKAQVGDYVEVMRAIRNLVHPSIYMREFPEKIGREHLDLSFKVLDTACSYLARALEEAKAHLM